jgi:hypothetical protein
MFRSRPIHLPDYTVIVLLHEIDEHRHSQDERIDVAR